MRPVCQLTDDGPADDNSFVTTLAPTGSHG
jgi:hypothetical protein